MSSSIWLKQDVEDHDDLVEIHYGLIANDATTVTDKVYVTLPDLDPGIRVGPCFWNPVSGQYPQKGNRAAVFFDNRGQPWIAQWGPLAEPGIKELTSSDDSLVIIDNSGPDTDIKVAGLPSARLYLPTAQSIPNGIWTRLLGANQDIGWTGMAVSTTYFTATVPKAGFYLFSAYNTWQGSTIGGRVILVRRYNSAGVDQEENEIQIAGEGMGEPMILTRMNKCAVGDYFEIYAYQSSGGDLTTSCDFHVVYMGSVI